MRKKSTEETKLKTEETADEQTNHENMAQEEENKTYFEDGIEYSPEERAKRWILTGYRRWIRVTFGEESEALTFLDFQVKNSGTQILETGGNLMNLLKGIHRTGENIKKTKQEKPAEEKTEGRESYDSFRDRVLKETSEIFGFSRFGAFPGLRFLTEDLINHIARRHFGQFYRDRSRSVFPYPSMFDVEDEEKFGAGFEDHGRRFGRSPIADFMRSPFGAQIINFGVRGTLVEKVDPREIKISIEGGRIVAVGKCGFFGYSMTVLDWNIFFEKVELAISNYARQTAQETTEAEEKESDD